MPAPRKSFGSDAADDKLRINWLAWSETIFESILMHATHIGDRLPEFGKRRRSCATEAALSKQNAQALGKGKLWFIAANAYRYPRRAGMVALCQMRCGGKPLQHHLPERSFIFEIRAAFSLKCSWSDRHWVNLNGERD